MPFISGNAWQNDSWKAAPLKWHVCQVNWSMHGWQFLWKWGFGKVSATRLCVNTRINLLMHKHFTMGLRTFEVAKFYQVLHISRKFSPVFDKNWIRVLFNFFTTHFSGFWVPDLSLVHTPSRQEVLLQSTLRSSFKIWHNSNLIEIQQGELEAIQQWFIEAKR